MSRRRGGRLVPAGLPSVFLGVGGDDLAIESIAGVDCEFCQAAKAEILEFV